MYPIVYYIFLPIFDNMLLLIFIAVSIVLVSWTTFTLDLVTPCSGLTLFFCSGLIYSSVRQQWLYVTSFLILIRVFKEKHQWKLQIFSCTFSCTHLKNNSVCISCFLGFVFLYKTILCRINVHFWFKFQPC